MDDISSIWDLIISHRTPKLVIVKNRPLGLLRIFLTFVCLNFIVFYQLWYQKGYQEIDNLHDAGLTVKIKGFST